MQFLLRITKKPAVNNNLAYSVERFAILAIFNFLINFRKINCCHTHGVVTTMQTDCADIMTQTQNRTNGVYTVFPPGCAATTCAIQVYCDLTTAGGGWTVIQRRQDGSENFVRRIADYINGFGILTNEFWLGNNLIYNYTNRQGIPYILRIDLTDANGNPLQASYDNFAIGTAANNFPLTLGNLVLGGVDNLALNRGRPFGTFDRETTLNGSVGCGAFWQSGWWDPVNCARSGDLNQPYSPLGANLPQLVGLRWNTTTAQNIRIMRDEMKIRPASFVSPITGTTGAARARDDPLDESYLVFK